MLIARHGRMALYVSNTADAASVLIRDEARTTNTYRDITATGVLTHKQAAHLAYKMAAEPVGTFEARRLFSGMALTIGWCVVPEVAYIEVGPLSIAMEEQEMTVLINSIAAAAVGMLEE